MNEAMFNRAMTRLSDDDISAIVARLAEQRLKEEVARKAFAHSETFDRMLDAMKSHGEKVQFDSEEVLYLAENVQKRLGWEFASAEDIDLFIAVVGEKESSSALACKEDDDPEDIFETETFEHFGLHVRKMYGQGTYISISYEPAS